EEKYRQVVENAKEAIFIVRDERITFCNQATMELSGASLEKLTSLPFVEFIFPDDRKMVYENYQKRIRGEDVPSSYEFRIVDGEGNVKWIELNVVRVNWEGRPATLNFAHEVTEKKELERHIFSERKMEAIGTLAGGMAHDFNNLLMGIMGQTSLMLMGMDSSHPFYDRLKSIENQVLAGAELTKQLLGYARTGHYELVQVDLNDILRRTVRFFWQAKKGIKLHQDYYPLLWPVDADREQIEEVFRQIFLNAWQAMPHGGTLRVKTENREMEERSIKNFRMPAGKYVHVIIGDTGLGMDEEVMARIFEPYFTTREMRRGAGLGLAAVYGVVKGHKGFIDVESEKGKGTTFHIYFPASTTEVKDISTPSVRPNEEEKNKTILLIEDEKMVLDVTRAMLDQLGYEVLCASSGKEGLEMFENKRPHLVVLDMVMPGMSGEEVFRGLKERDREARVLLASGYAAEEEVKHLLKEGYVGFIQKPYRLADLQAKITELLER
ncbi:MAG: response regulator, partial [Syntrophales bacterium]|nr:response regulator [Syntrophales bacterium]